MSHTNHVHSRPRDGGTAHDETSTAHHERNRRTHQRAKRNIKALREENERLHRRLAAIYDALNLD